MRTTIIPATVLLLVWSLSPAILSAAAPPPPGPGPDNLTASISAIDQAQDPSAAVSAFNAASLGNPNNPQVLSAYVQRMARLGVPEMALHQAEALTAADPNNGIGWAVIAFVDAKKGTMDPAFAAISRAAAVQPNDLFVQSTAGELVAWFDVHPSAVNDASRKSVDALRTSLGTRATYLAAYNQAKTALTSQSGAASATTPQLTPTVPDIPAAEQPPGVYPPQPSPAVPYYTGDVNNYYSYNDYAPLVSPFYAYPDYGYGAWWYPGDYFCGGLFGSPFYCGFGDYDGYGGYGGYYHHGWWNHNGGWNGTGNSFAGGARGGLFGANQVGANMGATGRFNTGTSLFRGGNTSPSLFRGGATSSLFNRSGASPNLYRGGATSSLFNRGGAPSLFRGGATSSLFNRNVTAGGIRGNPTVGTWRGGNSSNFVRSGGRTGYTGGYRGSVAHFSSPHFSSGFRGGGAAHFSGGSRGGGGGFHGGGGGHGGGHGGRR